MKRLINPAKALRTLRKTPVILAHLLSGLTQAQAEARRDGAEGWNLLYIVCHLRDMEAQYMGRIQDLLAAPNPIFRTVSNPELIERNQYAAQHFHAALAEYQSRRAQTLALLETLTDEQWLLSGTHPEQGPATLLDVAVNCGLHDIDHMEQIVRCA